MLSGFESCSTPLAPVNFHEKITRSTDMEVIHNLMCLNLQNISTAMAYACMEEIIHNGDDTHLDALARLTAEHSSNQWDIDGIKILVGMCLCKLVQPDNN